MWGNREEHGHEQQRYEKTGRNLAEGYILLRKDTSCNKTVYIQRVFK